jgi:tripartite-type tricarboxylate transporter receptor subunit TctC
MRLARSFLPARGDAESADPLSADHRRTGAKRLLLGIFALTSLVAVAHAQTPEEFFRGKQVRMIVGHPAGGDYDLGGRLLAKYLSRHLPGNPTIVVQNMPNGASVAAANYLFKVAPKDGTVFGSFSRNLPGEAVLGESQLEADPRQFAWLGATSLPSRICVSWFTSGVQRAQDVFDRELIVPGGGATSALSIIPTMLNNVLGTKFHIIQGYRAFPDAMLAMQRGEVDGLCNTYSQIASHQDLIRDGKIRILFHTEESPLVDRPEIPSIFQFVRSEEQAQVLRFVFSSAEFGRPYVLPPGTPADRVAAYRTAIKAAIADPDLIAESKTSGLDMSFKSAEESMVLLDKLYAMPPELLAVVRRISPTGRE